jgi:hypothetical protein
MTAVFMLSGGASLVAVEVGMLLAARTTARLATRSSSAGSRAKLMRAPVTDRTIGIAPVKPTKKASPPRGLIGGECIARESSLHVVWPTRYDQ